jgi:hypothetical protein
MSVLLVFLVAFDGDGLLAQYDRDPDRFGGSVPTDVYFLDEKQPLDEPLFDDGNDGGVTLGAHLRGFPELSVGGNTFYVDLVLFEASLGILFCDFGMCADAHGNVDDGLLVDFEPFFDARNDRFSQYQRVLRIPLT